MGYYHITYKRDIILGPKTWAKTCPVHGVWQAAAPNQKCLECRRIKEKKSGKIQSDS